MRCRRASHRPCRQHLPTFLKQETHFGAVDSGYILDTAEARHFHALAVLRTLLELIVIYDTLGAFRERDSHHEFRLGILGIAHRLRDFAEEDGACRKNGYIDESQHLDPFDTGLEPGGPALSVIFREHRTTALGDAFDHGKHARRSPRRHLQIRHIRCVVFNVSPDATS